MNDRFKFRFFNEYSSKLEFCDEYDLKDIFESGNPVMQCTGLKDKNGNLIYEGDILGGTFGNLYVHYCDNCKQFQLKANDYGCMACEGDIHWYEVVEDNNKLEVVGNIYENPELLGSEG